MAQTITVSRETLRQKLVDLAANNAVIDEVFIEPTQHAGEPDLMGVTIEVVAGEYVIFNQAGSGGLGRILVPLNRIVAIDTGI